VQAGAIPNGNQARWETARVIGVSE
jgi:hypothetical protein